LIAGAEPLEKRIQKGVSVEGSRKENAGRSLQGRGERGPPGIKGPSSPRITTQLIIMEEKRWCTDSGGLSFRVRRQRNYLQKEKKAATLSLTKNQLKKVREKREKVRASYSKEIVGAV